jgi:histone deacetylase HOS2
MGPRAAASVVQDYSHPDKGQTSTLTVDEGILASILQNDIKRPKGYTVSYHTNPEVERHHFGQNHPMKPWRLTLTNKIVLSYGMHTAMDMYLSRAATRDELMDFHHADYIKALES